MPVRKYKFVSPGVQTREVDNTQRPREAAGVGAIVIGRSKRGPSMIPVEVKSTSEFFETFGEPIPGGGTINNDVWRDGNYTAPTYGAYAAQAYLSSKGPLTFVRLTGDQHDQATTDGAAGWPQDGKYSPNALEGNNAGAYGLFLIDSGSAVDYVIQGSVTGTLGAVFYLKEGATLRLEGYTSYSKDTTYDELSGSGQPIRSVDVNKTFRAVINEGSGSVITASFNFQPDSNKFIRKVFNTNPILTNSSVTDSTSTNFRKYWLGQTFEDSVERNITGSTSGSVYGIVLPLISGSGASYGGDFRFRGRRGRTGWIFAQDLSNAPSVYLPQDMPKLFRFKTLTPGDWEQRNLKISITNIRASQNTSNQYGTFDIEIRRVDDNDQSKKVVERFSNCDLNPFSKNYIAKKIGDMYREWDYSERAYIEYGDFPNQSKFFYVDVANDVAQAQTDPRLLPFGFYGTPRYNSFVATQYDLWNRNDLLLGNETSNIYVAGTGSMPHVPSASNPTAYQNGILWSIPQPGFDDSNDSLNISASFIFPAHPLVVSASDTATTSPFDAYFGIDVFRNGSNRVFSEQHYDLVYPLSDEQDEDSVSTEIAYYFSLDDVRQASASNGSIWLADAFYESGSRRNTQQSITARGAISPLATLATSSYESVLHAGFNKFTLPVFDGFEGLEISEKEPFRNTLLSNGSEETSYSFHSVRRALDSISDQEVVEYELAAMPGIYDSALTRKLLDICEERSDSLAVIDLEGDYVPFTENTSVESSRRGNVDTTISNLKLRGLNTSYGCAYYPWVSIRDTVNDNIVTVPPSVVALGAFANTDKTKEPWFASAGFVRGGLSNGAAGLPVVNVKQKLKKKDRDKLQEANINPIAHFPNEGIVIMGQKTLQVVESALDRINVRRLLLVTKKVISNIAKNLLFEQNVKSTWNKFEGKVEPYLRSVQSRFGLSDFRVLLDETTTTEDLIDRNIMYAKIYLKPARSIEHIAIDFVITDTGASFED